MVLELYIIDNFGKTIDSYSIKWLYYYDTVFKIFLDKYIEYK
jgi:hypothetical protein